MGGVGGRQVLHRQVLLVHAQQQLEVFILGSSLKHPICSLDTAFRQRPNKNRHLLLFTHIKGRRCQNRRAEEGMGNEIGSPPSC